MALLFTRVVELLRDYYRFTLRREPTLAEITHDLSDLDPYMGREEMLNRLRRIAEKEQA